MIQITSSLQILEFTPEFFFVCLLYWAVKGNYEAEKAIEDFTHKFLFPLDYTLLYTLTVPFKLLCSYMELIHGRNCDSVYDSGTTKNAWILTDAIDQVVPLIQSLCDEISYASVDACGWTDIGGYFLEIWAS